MERAWHDTNRDGLSYLRKAKLSKHTQISKPPDLVPNLIPETSTQDLTFQTRDWESWSWGTWISPKGKSTNRGSCTEMVQTERPPESLRAVRPHSRGPGYQVSEERKQIDMKIKQIAMTKHLGGNGDYTGRINCKWKDAAKIVRLRIRDGGSQKLKIGKQNQKSQKKVWKKMLRKSTEA